MDVLALTNAATGALAVLFGALAWRENRRRAAAEEALHRERRERENMAARPALVIEHRDATWQPEHRRQVTLRVTNKGPTVAHQVAVCVRVVDQWTPQSEPFAALAPGESRDLVVVVEQERWQGALLRADAVLAVVRWRDQFGNEYSEVAEGSV